MLGLGAIREQCLLSHVNEKESVVVQSAVVKQLFSTGYRTQGIFLPLAQMFLNVKFHAAKLKHLGLTWTPRLYLWLPRGHNKIIRVPCNDKAIVPNISLVPRKVCYFLFLVHRSILQALFLPLYRHVFSVMK